MKKLIASALIGSALLSGCAQENHHVCNTYIDSFAIIESYEADGAHVALIESYSNGNIYEIRSSSLDFSQLYSVDAVFCSNDTPEYEDDHLYDILDYIYISEVN